MDERRTDPRPGRGDATPSRSIENLTHAETAERYRSLFDYHPDPVFSLDLMGRYVEANPASEHLSGYSAEELRAMTFLDLLAHEDVDRVSQAFVAVLGGESQLLDLGIHHRDGHLIDLRVTAVPTVVGGEVVGVFGLAEDVTEHNRLQRDLEEARRAAEQASEAKSLFLANMSHEIRTPLTTVLAAAEMLGDSGLDPDQRRLTDMMSRSGARLLRLIDEILDLSRVEAGRVTVEQVELDPAALLAEAVEAVRDTAAAKGLRLELALDPTLPATVVGDPVRIVQVVANLLENAVKFTDTGFVRAAALARPAGDRLDLVVTVEDTGIGLTKEQQAFVFEPFRQADPSITRRYGGTGLGLGIARQIVDLLGGSIDAVSRPGGGTTFTVEFPVGLPVERPPPPPPATRRTRDAGTNRPA